jgi:hypothetical protein
MSVTLPSSFAKTSGSQLCTYTCSQLWANPWILTYWTQCGWKYTGTLCASGSNECDIYITATVLCQSGKCNWTLEVAISDTIGDFNAEWLWYLANATPASTSWSIPFSAVYSGGSGQLCCINNPSWTPANASLTLS